MSEQKSNECKNVQTDDFLQLSSGTVSGGGRVHFQPFYFSGASFFSMGEPSFINGRRQANLWKAKHLNVARFDHQCPFRTAKICSLCLRSSPSFS